MSLLHSLLIDGFGKEEDYNCAEKILYGANRVYNLGLSKESLKLCAGFGGGMGIESSCGALAAGIMVLSHLFVENIAHEDTLIKEKTSTYLDRFNKEMNSINCDILKDLYRKEETGCDQIIFKSARILDSLYNESRGDI